MASCGIYAIRDPISKSNKERRRKPSRSYKRRLMAYLSHDLSVDQYGGHAEVYDDRSAYEGDGGF